MILPPDMSLPQIALLLILSMALIGIIFGDD